jgi:hypothetical protein
MDKRISLFWRPLYLHSGGPTRSLAYCWKWFAIAFERHYSERSELLGVGLRIMDGYGRAGG